MNNANKTPQTKNPNNKRKTKNPHTNLKRHNKPPLKSQSFTSKAATLYADVVKNGTGS